MHVELSRTLRAAVLATAMALTAGGVVACGSDDDDATTSSASAPATTTAPAAEKLTGTPVKIMVVAAVETAIQDYPDVFSAAKAAANAINAKGGIAGHPIEILTCNDKSDPNGAGSCAREAVTEKVAAYTAYSIGGAAALPVLDKAGIQSIGQALTPPDITAPNSWPPVGGPYTTFATIPFALKQAGHTKIATASTDVAAALGKADQIKQTLPKAGLELVGSVTMPAEATDFAPYVEQLRKTGADAVVVSASAGQIIQLQRAAKQLGLDVTFANHAGSISPEVVEELGDAGEGTIAVNSLPLAGSDQMKGFNAELDAAAAAGISDLENRRMATQESWLDIHAIAALLKDADPKAPITAATVLEALKAADTVDVDGVIQWKPNEKGAKDWPRVTTGVTYPGVVKDGELEPLPGAEKGLDVNTLLAGGA